MTPDEERVKAAYEVYRRKALGSLHSISCPNYGLLSLTCQQAWRNVVAYLDSTHPLSATAPAQDAPQGNVGADECHGDRQAYLSELKSLEQRVNIIQSAYIPRNALNALADRLAVTHSSTTTDHEKRILQLENTIRNVAAQLNVTP